MDGGDDLGVVDALEEILRHEAPCERR